MNRSTIMSVAAVITFVFGLGFILVPAQVMAIYGQTLDANGQWIARYLGSAFIGIAILNWMARLSDDSLALRAIVLADLAASATGLVVAFLDALRGQGNGLVWSTVVIYLLLTAAFAYLQFLARPAPAAPLAAGRP